MTPAAEMREALHAGRAAAESKQAPDNPHANGHTARDRALAVMWRKGYSAGNPVPR